MWMSRFLKLLTHPLDKWFKFEVAIHLVTMSVQIFTIFQYSGTSYSLNCLPSASEILVQAGIIFDTLAGID